MSVQERDICSTKHLNYQTIFPLKSLVDTSQDRGDCEGPTGNTNPPSSLLLLPGYEDELRVTSCESQLNIIQNYFYDLSVSKIFMVVLK